MHAFDAQSGKLLWKHTDQPVYNVWNSTNYRFDDGPPLVADGKVIIKAGCMLDRRHGDNEIVLRSFDPRIGAIAWSTEPIPETSAGGTLTQNIGASVSLPTENALARQLRRMERSGAEHAFNHEISGLSIR